MLYQDSLTISTLALFTGSIKAAICLTHSDRHKKGFFTYCVLEGGHLISFPNRGSYESGQIRVSLCSLCLVV